MPYWTLVQRHCNEIIQFSILLLDMSHTNKCLKHCCVVIECKFICLFVEEIYCTMSSNDDEVFFLWQYKLSVCACVHACAHVHVHLSACTHLCVLIRTNIFISDSWFYLWLHNMLQFYNHSVLTCIIHILKAI